MEKFRKLISVPDFDYPIDYMMFLKLLKNSDNYNRICFIENGKKKIAKSDIDIINSYGFNKTSYYRFKKYCISSGILIEHQGYLLINNNISYIGKENKFQWIQKKYIKKLISKK